ncbi:MAG TPA: 3-hydroxyacyl-CoA dehydrogenase NAD-binding domain-containing protein [Xanthobacteraceae bacterium]|jgi:3-hydroxyacyl-CoA dehydrogenase|nr:3-hydroxyacyl-CoA dehydrogenase NAD-binding domain-containing protein [Xanthobacteraceae bacterium]
MRREGAIAVIVIDNPPVNALKHEVRAGLVEAFERARDDIDVAAIVLACAGRTFVAGADITEFNKPPQSPVLGEVIALIDSVPKPVIAALHGTALGGGLELSLACHFRVAAPGTRLGLPEVKLGLLPGAGGTQRLPRLIGVEKALKIIVSGDPITADEALRAGLVDEIITGDLSEGAIRFAERVVAEKGPLRRVRDMEDKLEPLRANPAAFADIAAGLSKRSRGLDAPLACIEAVRWTLDVPIDEALKRERAKFMELREGDQSKAQRHIFFAEREAAKVPDMPAGIKPREVARAAVIGAGTMGGGIAMSFANAGIPVTVIEASEQALNRGLDTITKNYRNTAARGGLAADEMERRINSITGSTAFDTVSQADIVIEAIFEEMDIKKQVFGDLDRLTKPETVLATNTSYLDVNVIAQSTKRPGSVLGMHFFSPANIMRLCEIVRGDATAPDVLASAIAVARKLGKVPVVVGVCHGFVGNRMLRARSIEGERLLLEGALPQDVDRAIVEFGFPMGPFAMSDLAGLDVSWRMRKAQGARAEIADALCEAGRFGQKTGKGFYRYEAGARTPLPDPEVEQMIVAASARLGIKRRAIDTQEIVERLIFPMINEGARILEEGVALRSGDIDVIWIYGYGWPVWRGGPMYYADRVGISYIRDRLAEFAARSSDPRHEPANLIKQYANDGGTFGAFVAKSKS